MTTPSLATVLVTGSSGFIGSHIAAHLQGEGWHVVGLCRNRGDFGQIRQHRLELPNPGLAALIADLRPQIIVHCAGPASVPASVASPADDFEGTVPVMFQLLDNVRRYSPQSGVLYISSAAVYGNARSLPIAETDEIRPISPYGFHRSLCEQLLQQFRTLHSIRSASLRVFSAYGAGLRRQVIWDLCMRSLNEERLHLHGTGLESRDFVHASDIAQAIGLLAATPVWEAIYNLGAGEETAIADLANAITSLLPAPIPVTFEGSSAAGMPDRVCADMSRLRRLGFVPRRRLLDELPGLLELARRTLEAPV